MNRFLAGLGARERFLLIAAGVLLVLFLLYLLAWKPLQQRTERLRVTVHEQQALEQWMTAAAQEARRLRAVQPATQRAERQSLLALTDRTAREAGLGPAIRRVEPEGSDRARIVLEQVAFDDLATWLEQLVVRHQIVIDSVTVDNRNEPGLVNARLVLQAPAS
jgi:general secretion pathway protein M